jgi:hypothetical protein
LRSLVSRSVLKTSLNRERSEADMQWYVYLVATIAAAFLAQIALELFGRPIRAALALRRKALERMFALRNIPLPRPRELATSSREICEYESAVRGVSEAQHTLRDIGVELLAFGEREPAARVVIALFGLDVARAGHELINLSEVYAEAKIGSDELLRTIDEAHHVTSAALAHSRRLSGNGLIKIRLEPMHHRC